jgi:type IV fimbrial biogenesis protein FimT
MSGMLNNTIKRSSMPLATEQGFTLLELIITLAIAAIVATLAVPSYNTMIKNNSQKAHINELAGALYLARSEAVSNNQNVVICQSNDTITPDCTDTNNWNTGWLMYIDADGSNTYENTETVLKIGRDISSGSKTLTRSVFGSGELDYIRYSPSGTTDANSGSSFVLCDSRGTESAKGINISKLGRSNTAVDTDDDGVIEDEGGSNITCP